jgi:magnesium-transporting ATPase (P-type)
VRAGDLVPANTELNTSAHLRVDKAALTGESLPVEKHGHEDRVSASSAGRVIVGGVVGATVSTGPTTTFLRRQGLAYQVSGYRPFTAHDKIRNLSN